MPKRKRDASWWESLTIKELIECLRALHAPTKGTKPELVARLTAHPESARYSKDGRANKLTFARVMAAGTGYDSGDECTPFDPFEGCTKSDLQEECKAKGLKSTGNRYELVLSLLRIAGGAVLVTHTPRAPSTKAEAPDKITARIVAKWKTFYKKQSDRQIKAHASDCFMYAAGILEKELNEKALLASRNPAAVEALLAVLRGLDPARNPPLPSKPGEFVCAGYGWGPCASYYSYEFHSLVEKVVEAAAVMKGGAQAPLASEQQLVELQELCNIIAQEARKCSLYKEADSLTQAFGSQVVE